MEKEQLKPILEAVLMASSSPLALDALAKIFPENEQPETAELETVLEEMQAECEGRSYELKKVSSGYRFQVRKDYADYVTKLWEDKPARYSRALLETLALIAYRQPITRGEIEAVRGVSVSSHIIKTLHERDWIKVVGHRDVPGKPSLYATTRAFLDYFNLVSLDDLPSLQEIRDIDQINAELDLRLPEAVNEDQQPGTVGQETGEADVSDADSDTETAVISLDTAGDENTEDLIGEDESSEQVAESAVVNIDASDESDNAETADESEEREKEESKSSYEAASASAEN